MRSHSRILIVGGGIAGLALGRALREQGVGSEIIERATSWPTRGTGLYLPGNGVRALEVLGFADTVLARAVCMSHQRILDHAGRQLAEIELAKLWNRVGVCVGIARGELHHILDRGCRDPNCPSGSLALRAAGRLATTSGFGSGRQLSSSDT